MLIDTGASVSIIHTLDPQSHPLSTGQKVGLEAFQGSHAEAYQSSKTKLLIADAAFDLSALLMTLPNSMSILGSNFLKQHEAVIDFTNSKIWFKGNGNYCVISDAHAVSAIKNPEFFEMPTHSDPRVAQIIHECTDVFGKHKHDCGRLEGEVSIPGRAHEPQKQYPIPKASESYIQNTIDSLLQQGVLRVCESTTNSPIWPVEKPDGSWRLTIDYRKLNSVTPACAPVVRETPTLLSSIPPRAKYFSSIDICNSFWNIAVELRSQYKLAFTWKDQQYTWNCLPQGLHNSPTIYHKKMAAVLKGFTKPENLLQYVDDLLLATETEEEHLSLLKELLHLLHRAGLKVNPKKCQFMQTSVTFLGMNITPEGKLPDKHKMDTIQRLNLPASKTALRSFLGLVQYQRDFIPFFADKARPLYDLLKKEVPEEDIRGEWREPHTQAFNVLKQSMMEATALLTPDPKKRFHLEVAATDTALAAVLCQEKHGKLKPIAYASRVLSAVEIKFTACERHLLATFWAIEHFTYITGLQSLTLHSPHTPLNLLLKPDMERHIYEKKHAVLCQGKGGCLGRSIMATAMVFVVTLCLTLINTSSKQIDYPNQDNSAILTIRNVKKVTAVITMTIRDMSNGVVVNGTMLSGSEGEWVIVQCHITASQLIFPGKLIRWTYPGGTEIHTSTELYWTNTTEKSTQSMLLLKNISLTSNGIVTCSPEGDWAEGVWDSKIRINILKSEVCPELQPISLSGLTNIWGALQQCSIHSYSSYSKF
uniref:ribonuclease H n=1 Tax=Xenopus tropicalis TaxID=8364 RepID=A0A803K6K2_XENTR